MKPFVLLCALLFTVPASAQDDCPAGHIRNPAISPLDHAYMLSAFKASFKGIIGREPSCQPGSGIDDCEYYIAAVTDVEQSEWFDPNFLAQLVGAATKITLAEAEKKVQSLRIR